MKIGINAVGLLPGVIGGGETYIRGLVGGLSRLRCHDQFVLFTNRENHPTFGGLGPNFRRIRFNFSARWTIPSLAMTRVVGEQFFLPWRAAREGLDVIHSPLDTVPLMARCATVMTLHDANFDALPEATSRLQRRIARALVKISARRAHAILTVSEFSRREIVAAFGIDPQRQFVVHNGADADRHSNRDDRGRRELQARIVVAKPYIVAFSSINPHKNIGALIRAFARMRSPERGQLVVLGHLPAAGEELPELAQSLGIRQDVTFTGYVAEHEKVQLLRNARLMAFPSLYEGFGIPVIEAMREGIPVVCSNRAALPEVAGAAARLFDPTDIDELRAALEELLTDEALRAPLIAAGYLNAQRFSWDRAARLTMRVYRQAAHAVAGSNFAELAGPEAEVSADSTGSAQAPGVRVPA